MTCALNRRYRDFGPEVSDGAPETAMPQDALEDMRLASFDAGYQAGWEDAVTAHAQESERTASAVAQNLQDLSFTCHEAFLKLTAASRPMMAQVVETLLPQIARRALGAHLVEQIAQLAADHAGGTFEIVVSPDQRDEIDALLKGAVQVPFTVGTDRLLTPGQGYLGVGGQEREIDLDAVVSAMGAAFDAFYDDIQKETDHG